jgi:hypothetical protein
MAPTGAGTTLTSMRRPPLAFLILGVLSLLAVGAALLGVAQAPTGADVAVHNAAVNTLSVNQVVGHVTATGLGKYTVDFTFVAPDQATEVEKAPGGAVKAGGKVSGDTAAALLNPIRDALDTTGFSGKGPKYVTTTVQSLADGANGTVAVTARTTVLLDSGYVVGVAVRRSATVRGRHVVTTVAYTYTRVGSWEAS